MTPILLVLATIPSAHTIDEQVDEALSHFKVPGLIRSAIGVTRKGTTIPCFVTPETLNPRGKKMHLLVIGGLDGSDESFRETLSVISDFYKSRPDDAISMSAVPLANPDGWALGAGPGNGVGGSPTKRYPPAGSAYTDAKNPEAQYLWRWIGMHAPDRVIVYSKTDAGQELVDALNKGKPSGTGAVSAVFVKLGGKRLPVDDGWSPKFSEARTQLRYRTERKPLDIAKRLAARYGHQLNSVAYIPALALVGRLRIAEMTSQPELRNDVVKIVDPYYTGEKPTMGKQVSGSNLSGHLIFTALARQTGNKRYIELARAAADLGFNDDGSMKPSMPFHNEMSDAVFMGTPILVEVGQLTGERRYFDMAVRHMRFMLKLNVRPDGLHRHSPLDPTPWGRGNGFPALGLALSLSALPADHPGFDEMLAAFRTHMAAMANYQDPTGMWHQVVDHPGSYRELTSTCMTTFAIVRGLRRGWLDAAKYRPVAGKAWEALKARIADDGSLVDVCTGSGKQRSLRAYLDRTAILGFDDRGGAMALLVSTEMAAWKRDGKR